MEKNDLLTQFRGHVAEEKYHKLLRALFHDIGNPILTIKSLSKLVLTDSSNLNKEDLWSKIHRAAENMHSTLNMIRNEESLIENTMAISLSEICIMEILDESLFIFKDKIKEKNISIVRKFEDENTRVMAEKITLLNNIFNNIISNAIKYSHNTGLIEITQKFRQEWNIIEFKDSGIGIPSELLEEYKKKLNINTRVGTYGEVGTGNGIPLMVSYMKIFNGKLEFESSTKDDNNNQSWTKVTLFFPKN